MDNVRAFPSPPHTTTHARHGMAATSNPDATRVALDILKDGGNAIDAAVAAAAVLAVVEPMSTGIGGDVFCLYAPGGSSRIVAYNGSGRTPRKADLSWYLERDITTIAADSAHAVTIPGCVEAWCRLIDDHGSMPIGEILEPAIRLATEGYVIQPVIHAIWQASRQRLVADPHAASLLLVDGHAPAPGDVHSQPLLAATLREIAERGRAGFYEGWVAEDIVQRLGELGGLHDIEDFASAAGEYVEPICSDMGGYTVHECPPNGQGLVALIMMNILEGFGDTGGDPLSADRIHLSLEAGRLAFRDRALYVADPTMADVPVDTLLSPAYTDMLRSHIDPTRAMAGLPPAELPATPSTVYLAVVDRDRNAASFINSLYFAFGSSRVAPKSGVTLHNRGCGFVLEPGHRNALAPGKRPMHTIIPAMLTKGDRAVMPFGVMGGDYQPWGHTHVLQNMLHYGMSPQEALDLPRFCYQGGVAMMEPAIPGHVMHDLANRGHLLGITPEPFGGGQAIWIDWDKGTLAGGSESRKDGIALGY